MCPCLEIAQNVVMLYTYGSYGTVVCFGQLFGIFTSDLAVK